MPAMTAFTAQHIRDAIRHHRRYHWHLDDGARPGSIRECCNPPCFDEVQAWYAARRARRMTLVSPPRDLPGAGVRPVPGSVQPEAVPRPAQAGRCAEEDRGCCAGGRGITGWINLSVSCRAEGHVYVITVTGEVDVCSAPRLEAVSIELAAAGRRRLVIDLDRCTFLDAAGLGIIVGAKNRAGRGGGDLVLARAPWPIRKLLRVTDLTGLFRIYDTPGEAVAAFCGAGENRDG